jgi:hypothetical protein
LFIFAAKVIKKLAALRGNNYFADERPPRCAGIVFSPTNDRRATRESFFRRRMIAVLRGNDFFADEWSPRKYMLKNKNTKKRLRIPNPSQTPINILKRRSKNLLYLCAR